MWTHSHWIASGDTQINSESWWVGFSSPPVSQCVLKVLYSLFGSSRTHQLARVSFFQPRLIPNARVLIFPFTIGYLLHIHIDTRWALCVSSVWVRFVKLHGVHTQQSCDENISNCRHTQYDTLCLCGRSNEQIPSRWALVSAHTCIYVSELVKHSLFSMHMYTLYVTCATNSHPLRSRLRAYFAHNASSNKVEE